MGNRTAWDLIARWPSGLPDPTSLLTYLSFSVGRTSCGPPDKLREVKTVNYSVGEDIRIGLLGSVLGLRITKEGFIYRNLVCVDYDPELYSQLKELLTKNV